MERYRSGYKRFALGRKPCVVYGAEFAVVNRISPFIIKQLNNIWKGIEVVITSRTRNAVVGQLAHGFESHPFRQRKKTFLMSFFCCVDMRWFDSNPSFGACAIVTKCRCVPSFPPTKKTFF